MTMANTRFLRVVFGRKLEDTIDSLMVTSLNPLNELEPMNAQWALCERKENGFETNWI